MLSRSLFLGDAGLGDHRDLRELALRVRDPLRFRQVEQRGGRAREAVGVAELRDPDEVVDLRCLRREDLDPVADAQVRLVGAVLVDDDLIVGGRRLALDEMERGELVVGLPREPERRRALTGVADDLAVLLDDLRVLDPDSAGGGLDTVGLLHGGEELDRDVGPVAGTEVAGEHFVRAHDRVGVAVDVREQVVERLLDRRGEHERSRHERDAEHDRDSGEQETQLVCDQTLTGELPHQSPNVRILSRIESAVGSLISSTMRPSARNTTRCA